jgi:predicted metalloprotease with PDZ domain
MLKRIRMSPVSRWARLALAQMLIIAYALAVGSCAISPEPQKADIVHYSVSPIKVEGKVVALEVEMRFAGDVDGETLVQLPTSSGSERELWKAVKNINVSGGSLERRSNFQLVIDHTASHNLIISYDIVSTHPNELISEPDPGQDRAIIRPSWVNFIGKTVFSFPVGTQTRPASFVWRNLPSTWTWGSDLQQNGLTVGGVLDSSTLAGVDVQKRTLDLENGKLTLVWRGSFDLDLETTFDAFARIVNFQHDFWRSGSNDLTVTIVPLLETVGPKWVMGTGLGDGFAIWAASNAPIDGLEYIFTHELLHEWINHRGLHAEDASLAQSEAWFVEGFTDYYTVKGLVKTKTWSDEQAVNWLNGVLLEYQTSPGRGKPNDLVTSKFWTDPVFERLPYVRGSLVAMLLDNSLRKTVTFPNGLDDVMRLWDTAAKGRNKSSVQVLKEILGASASRSAVSNLQSYAIEGADVPFELLGGWNCMAIQNIAVAEFERGFDLAGTIQNANAVVGVVENGVAFRAGLRNGMRLEKLLADRPRNSNIPVQYELRTLGGESVVLSWLPQSGRSQNIWQFSKDLRASGDYDHGTGGLDCGL